jgi:hypothetical protein
MKQFMSGAGIVLIATLLVPSLKTYLAKLELSQKGRVILHALPLYIRSIKSRAKRRSIKNVRTIFNVDKVICIHIG